MKWSDVLAACSRKAFSMRGPQLSLFHTSATGEYTLLLQTQLPGVLLERFKAEAIKPSTVGLEARCDGFRVEMPV